MGGHSAAMVDATVDSMVEEARQCYGTVYDAVHHTPLGRFSAVDISTVGTVSALETSRRDHSEDVSFGIGTFLVVEQSSLENRPRGV